LLDPEDPEPDDPEDTEFEELDPPKTGFINYLFPNCFEPGSPCSITAHFD